MFSIDLNEIDWMNGVAIRSAGAGCPLVIFPGMEGSGESCLQVVAGVLHILKDSSCSVRLVLVDYSAEDHGTFDALINTVLELLRRTMEERSVLSGVSPSATCLPSVLRMQKN